MSANEAVNIELKVAFPNAGIEFQLSAKDESGAIGFRLEAVNAATGAAVQMDVQTSPVLADWGRGYSRWLYRPRIAATFGESAITGTFLDGTSSEQVMDGLEMACDMIRQRFGLYQESILA
ncbi:MAG: hypothetical protein FI707_02430 [SAR202 cluster bacterium]|jgi:hypothetical protein|nr:hypothetical protein [Chloroflexota bacterium]MDP6422507.1 hypothetical protein [SAR202 cluster bacterium]HAL48993.1 hypothetical protein [Dehalococcoidia bacterium]MDP6663573.1 hypothetical protein [SAR202 cluster bacterium]MDP6799867.1 hypothetical protein [SAR202 cluster bacterium]|tara:strand:+ start:4837 stop:5199 length:363 start_codon:yes stop_codon:yes gene_type:complete